MENLFSVFPTKRDFKWFIDGVLCSKTTGLKKTLLFLAKIDFNNINDQDLLEEISNFWCETFTNLSIRYRIINSELSQEEIEYLILSILNTFSLSQKLNSVQPLYSIFSESDINFQYTPLSDINLQNFIKFKSNFPSRKQMNFSSNLYQDLHKLKYRRACEFICELISLQNSIKEDSPFFSILNSNETVKINSLEEFNIPSKLNLYEESLQYILLRDMFEKITGKRVPRIFQQNIEKDYQKENKSKEENTIFYRFFETDPNISYFDFIKTESSTENAQNQEVKEQNTQLVQPDPKAISFDIPKYIYFCLNENKEIQNVWCMQVFNLASDIFINKNKDHKESIAIPLNENDLNPKNEKDTVAASLYSLLGLLSVYSIDYDINKLVSIALNNQVCEQFSKIIITYFPEIKSIVYEHKQNEIYQKLNNQRVNGKDFEKSYFTFDNHLALKLLIKNIIESKDFASFYNIIQLSNGKTNISSNMIFQMALDIMDPQNYPIFVDNMLAKNNESFSSYLISVIGNSLSMTIFGPLFGKYPQIISRLFSKHFKSQDVSIFLNSVKIDSLTPSMISLIEKTTNSLPFFSNTFEIANKSENSIIPKRGSISVTWPEDEPQSCNTVCNEEEANKQKDDDPGIDLHHECSQCRVPNKHTAFWCYTCGITNNKYICLHCAECCHCGHDVVFANFADNAKECSCNETHNFESTQPISQQEQPESNQNQEAPKRKGRHKRKTKEEKQESKRKLKKAIKTPPNPNHIIQFLLSLSKSKVSEDSIDRPYTFDDLSLSTCRPVIESSFPLEEYNFNSDNLPMNDDFTSSCAEILDDWLEMESRQECNPYQIITELSDGNYFLAIGNSVWLTSNTFLQQEKLEFQDFIIQLIHNPSHHEEESVAVVEFHRVSLLVYHNSNNIDMDTVLEYDDDFIQTVVWHPKQESEILVLFNNSLCSYDINEEDSRVGNLRDNDSHKFSSLSTFEYNSQAYAVIGCQDGTVLLVNLVDYSPLSLIAGCDNMVVSTFDNKYIFMTSYEEFEIIKIPDLMSDLPTSSDEFIGESKSFSLDPYPGPCSFIGYDKESGCYLFIRPVDQAIITLSINSPSQCTFRIPEIRNYGIQLLENNYYTYSVLYPSNNIPRHLFISPYGSLYAVAKQKQIAPKIDIRRWTTFHPLSEVDIKDEDSEDINFLLRGRRYYLNTHNNLCKLTITPKNPKTIIAGFQIFISDENHGRIPLYVESEGETTSFEKNVSRFYSIEIHKLKEGPRELIFFSPWRSHIDRIDVLITKDLHYSNENTRLSRIIERICYSLPLDKLNDLPQITEENQKLAISAICSLSSQNTINLIIIKFLKLILNYSNCDYKKLISDYFKGSSQISGPLLVEAAKHGQLNESYWESNQFDNENTILAAFLSDK